MKKKDENNGVLQIQRESKDTNTRNLAKWETERNNRGDKRYKKHHVEALTEKIKQKKEYIQLEGVKKKRNQKVGVNSSKEKKKEPRFTIRGTKQI